MNATTQFLVDGVEETMANFEMLSKATTKNVMRRAARRGGEPIAAAAAALAPEDRGILSFSVVVADKLTARHRGEMRNRPSEVEVYVGPGSGLGALYYASHEEFGTVTHRAQPYMRPGWESTKYQALRITSDALKDEIMKAALRAQRKAARVFARR